jgi:Beta-propeller repeat
VRLDEESGDLEVTGAGGEVRLHKPVAYQVVAGERVTVEARYALGVGNRVGLELGRYDATQPLIINPVLYSTYLGGCSLDLSSDIAVDQAGNAYVTGYTNSADFSVHPPNNGFQGPYDAFVAKIGLADQ